MTADPKPAPARPDAGATGSGLSASAEPVPSAPTEPDTNRGLILWLWRGYLHQHIWLLILALIFMSIEGAMFGVGEPIGTLVTS